MTLYAVAVVGSKPVAATHWGILPQEDRIWNAAFPFDVWLNFALLSPQKSSHISSHLRPALCSLVFRQKQESFPSPSECKTEHTTQRSSYPGGYRISSTDRSRITSLDTNQPHSNSNISSGSMTEMSNMFLLQIRWDNVLLTFSLNF